MEWAMCSMASPGQAPCQCFSPAGMYITSAGRMTRAFSPLFFSSQL